jgi:hypothetical protein
MTDHHKNLHGELKQKLEALLHRVESKLDFFAALEAQDFAGRNMFTHAFEVIYDDLVKHGTQLDTLEVTLIDELGRLTALERFGWHDMSLARRVHASV